MKANLYRIAIPFFFFCFILAGHFFLTDFAVYQTDKQWEVVSIKTYLINHFTNKNIYLGYSYAIAGAFATICLLNLITASGGLKQSIRGITVSAVLWAGICFMSGCCGSPMLTIYLSLFGSAIIGLTKPLTAGVTTLSIVASYYYVMRFSNKNLIYSVSGETNISETNNPFAKVKRYTLPHPVIRFFKTVLMTIFRLFPNPAPLGLYAFGNPSKNSPVLVTTNYELTLYRVAKTLSEIDCYLLVVDGKGVNVWCSAGAGHLTVQSVVDGIRLSNINELVDHRNLIMPQLSAVGICRDELKAMSEWNPKFGPVYIEDIKAYLNGGLKKNESMRSAKFELMERIEMAIGSAFIFTFALICVMVFVNAQSLFFLIPAVYVISILFGILSPTIPFKSGFAVGSLYALTISAIYSLTYFILIKQGLGHFLTFGIPLFIAAFYISNEFMGWSPLIKYNMQMMLTGKWEAEIEVDNDKCTGCALCVSVCPVNVFSLENKKSVVLNRTNCEGCKACFYQCPENAINHSLQNEDEKCACVYCNIQDQVSE